MKLAGVVEDMVKCNNAIDIYEQYFLEVGAGPVFANGVHSTKAVRPQQTH